MIKRKTLESVLAATAKKKLNQLVKSSYVTYLSGIRNLVACR